jgi:hypothetical protein
MSSRQLASRNPWTCIQHILTVSAARTADADFSHLLPDACPRGRVATLAKTAIEYPPMQDPASFNLDATKKKIDEVIRQHHGE